MLETLSKYKMAEKVINEPSYERDGNKTKYCSTDYIEES